MNLEQLRKETWDRVSKETGMGWFPGAEALFIILFNAIIKVLLPMVKSGACPCPTTFGLEVPDSLLDVIADTVLNFLKIDVAQRVLWKGIVKLAIQYLLQALTGPKAAFAAPNVPFLDHLELLAAEVE